jgi:hypothetical protein
MVRDVLGMVWRLAASLGMGWVYIATPHKLAITVLKLVTMVCKEQHCCTRHATLLGCGPASLECGTAAAPRNRTGQLRENTITFLL